MGIIFHHVTPDWLIFIYDRLGYCVEYEGKDVILYFILIYIGFDF